MSEASTPPIEIQAHVACPLNVDAQDAQESKLQELITCACKQNKPFMLDGGSTKSEGTSILLCECQQDAILGEYKMGLQLALKSSRCQTMKTASPAVGKLHCCITEVDSI